MLAYVAGVIEPELWFAKRCIKVIKMALISENNTVCSISNMGQYSSYSIMGANIKHFNDKYCMDERRACVKRMKMLSVCMQVKELVGIRDRCMYKDWALNRGNAVKL